MIESVLVVGVEHHVVIGAEGHVLRKVDFWIATDRF